MCGCNSYRLRPHHALCIRFFEGKGYSADFVKNMNAVIQQLSGNAEVHFVNTCDLICRACPHNHQEKCDCKEKVRRYDNAVLSLCGLEEEEVISWTRLQALVQQKILDKGSLETVCGDCQWYSLCNK